MPTVVVAHEDRLVREAVWLACESHGIDVLASARSIGELVERAVALGPDVLVTADNYAPSGVDEALSAMDHPARIVLLTPDASPDEIAEGVLAAAVTRGAMVVGSHAANPGVVADG